MGPSFNPGPKRNPQETYLLSLLCLGPKQNPLRIHRENATEATPEPESHSRAEAIFGTETESNMETISGIQRKCGMEIKTQTQRKPRNQI